jgi:hypothetical protein
VADNSGQFVKNDPRRGTKPRGSQHHRTKFLNALKASRTTEEQFIEKILAMAQDGNTTALGIAATRLWRESKPTFDVFELPESDSPEQTIEHITHAMTTGQVAPDWAQAAMQVLRAGAELTEIKELLQIVKKLEGS